MLVLLRNVGESVLIGDDIRVVVTKVEAGGRVYLGIEAPREIPILRDDAVRRAKKP